MLTIAHITLPVIVEKSSDLIIAQPITFETMRIAKEFSRQMVDSTLYAVQFSDEERIQLPQCFRRTPDLTRSIGDLMPFKERRKLALIKDILDRLYDHSQAEYFIFTNVDIALQPNFYWTVSKIVELGYDAFIINRRTISDKHRHLNEIPLMYSELGKKHKGWDCFIFKRSLYPQFELGTSCIGTGWIGRVLIVNMASLADQFKIFTDLHLTFHIGNEKSWKASKYSEYFKHNQNECKEILLEFDKKYGPFDREKFPGRFFKLLEKRGQI